IRLAAELGDFLLEDRRNLRRANFHQNLFKTRPNGPVRRAPPPTFPPFGARVRAPVGGATSTRQGSLPLPASGERAGVRGNWRHYTSPKIPFSARALHGQLQPLQLALEGSIDHPRSELDDHAADQARVDLDLDRN